MTVWIVLFIALVFIAKAIAGVARAASSTTATHQARQTEWIAACEALGLQTAPVRRNRSLSARGVVNGHRISIEDDPRGPEIEVDFDTKIARLDIRPVRVDVRTKIVGMKPVATGDVVFDAQMLVHAADPAAAIEFMTPLRRESILALNAAVIIEEIDDDEIEVRVPSTEWTASELVDAVELVAQVAHILTSDADPVPQDIVRSTSTPQDAIR